MSDSEEQVLKETSEEVENMEEELLPAGPTISGLISLLQASPQTSEATDELKQIAKEGILFKRKTSKWREFYAKLVGDELGFYRSKESAKPSEVAIITYITSDIIKEHDKLALQQVDSAHGNVCKYRVSLFTTRRYYQLSAPTDDEMEEWMNTISNALQLKYSAEELEEKRSAAEKVAPLLEQQNQMQQEHYKNTMKLLDDAGFIEMFSKPKVHEGYLKLQSDNFHRTWRKYYFVLHPKYLYIYTLQDKAHPHGVIAIKFISKIEPLPGGSGSQRRFVIVTPLRSYFLRARHEVAMDEWIRKISEQCQSRGEMAPSKPYEGVSAAADLSKGDIFHGKLQLEYSVGKKHKTYTSSGKSITMGRATSNQVALSDTKVSRNHAKIEFTRDGHAILMDLGSSRGTWLNSEKVTKEALKVGDEIRLGKTVLVVKEKGSKGHEAEKKSLLP